MDLGLEGGFMVHNRSLSADTLKRKVADRLDEGWVRLKPTRFETVFANDIIPEAGVVWNQYFQKQQKATGKYHVESIVDLVKQHEAGNKVFPKQVDVVTGGFPCQDFSLAGKRNGFQSHKNHKGQIIQPEDEVATEETRGQLYMWMKRVIEINLPKVFIAENVKGLVSLSNVKEIIQKDFSSAGGDGYIVLEPRVLHAADFGVPQSRERVIFIGLKKSALKPDVLAMLESGQTLPTELDPYPRPTHAFTSSDDNLEPFVKLGELLANWPEPHESEDPTHSHYSKAKYMGAHCQGQAEIKLNKLGMTIRAEHHGNIEFRRLSHQNGGTNTLELALGKPERRLTPRECALIQTFPPDYDFIIPHTHSARGFKVSPSIAYKVIGNAVPPVLAYNIGQRLEELWEELFV